MKYFLRKTHLKILSLVQKHSYVASSTPFPLNIYSCNYLTNYFANFTNLNKSKVYTLRKCKKKVDFFKPNYQNTSLIALRFTNFWYSDNGPKEGTYMSV